MSARTGRHQERGGPLTDRRAVTLIARREVRDRLRQKSYLFGVVVMLVFVIAAVLLPAVLDRGDGTTSYDLVVVDEQPGTVGAAVRLAAGQLGREVTVLTGADRAAAETALRDGSADAALVERDELVSERAPDGALVEVVEAARSELTVASRLQSIGVESADVAAVIRPPLPVELVELDRPGEASEASDVERAIGVISAFLLFSAVTSTSSLILTGTMEEKTNHVVEVLLGTVRPRHLLAGKLIGLGVLGLAQMVLLAAVGVGAGVALDRLALPDIPLPLVGCALAYFLGGFVLYSSLYAAAGAVSNSPEDAQSTATPIIIGLLAGWIVAAAVIPENPDGLVARIVCLIPLTSPVAMPARVAIGDVPAWELALSLVVLAVSTWGIVRLGARLYAMAILSSSSFSWRRLLRTRTA